MVDLTIEEGQRLKVVYGSCRGFHAVDLDTMDVFDIYIPQHVCHVLFYSVLQPSSIRGLAMHTTYILSPFIPVLCHSD